MKDRALSLAKRWWLPVLGIVLGAGSGAAYAHFVGCPTGGCPLTSNPVITTALGALLGYGISGGPANPGDRKEGK